MVQLHVRNWAREYDRLRVLSTGARLYMYLGSCHLRLTCAHLHDRHAYDVNARRVNNQRDHHVLLLCARNLGHADVGGFRVLYIRSLLVTRFNNTFHQLLKCIIV